jgi:hypothetical protein
MNYQKIYNNITSNAKLRKKDKGLERHHIIPSSCGGTNDKSNCVYLSTREHVVCHLLLVKIYKDNSVFRKKMIYALWWMAKTRNNKNGCRITSWAYANARDEFIKNNPNKCDERKKQFKENHKNGNYNYDYEKVSNTLKETLSKLTKEEMLERMRQSALNCDQEKRGNSIKKGKASKFLLTTTDNKNTEFWSYENVLEITGYEYNQILYRIKRYDGKMQNGSKIKYLEKYKGNDGNIGRKRNNSI